VSRLPPEIVVTGRVRIPSSEIALSYARSGGPGGQHVNRTESKVLLRWDALASTALSDEDRALLARALASRLTAAGELLVVSDVHRDQSRNVDEVVERFRRLVRAALARPKPRTKTRPTRSSRERRLAGKRRRGATKRGRRTSSDD
jgi:ribosome-associated protein